MNILGIDVETTGLDPKTDQIVELGLVLWDWELKKPLMIQNLLRKPTIPMSDEAAKITGITESDFQYAYPNDYISKIFLSMVNKADYLMAHNAQFDKAFTTKAFPGVDLPKPWLCSREDISYDPITHRARNLVTLAATHGFVNPFPHRAMSDVLTMLKIASNYPIEDMIARSQSPAISIISLAPFERKDEVKGRGFHWHPDRKLWILDVKECDLEGLSFEFATRNEPRKEL